MEKTYVVRIFDGENTTIYATRDTDAIRAKDKIRRYHIVLGGDVEKITVTEQGA